MRSGLFEFFPLSEQELEALWEEATIVVDANVLLNLYRTPDTAREEILSTFKKLEQRLWIPFHAALEYQRNRPLVIHERKQKMGGFSEATKNALDEIKKSFANLEASKHDPRIMESELLQGIQAAYDQLATSADAVCETSLSLSLEDPLRDRISSILENRTGLAPKDAADLERLTGDADNRYRISIPPGFKDSGKQKDGVSETFAHGGLVYENKHGDLIIWRQLIDHVISTGTKKIIFITDDRKEDWWWEVKGRKLGPHPSLREEIRRVAEVDLFWMYSTANFLSHAGKYVRANVSETAITEVEDVARLADAEQRQNRISRILARRSEVNLAETSPDFLMREAESAVERAVLGWACDEFGWADMSGSFPDIIAGNDLSHGIEVKYIPRISPRTIRGLAKVVEQASSLLERVMLDKFTLVLVQDFSSRESSVGDTMYVVEMVRALCDSLPCLDRIKIVFGSTNSKGRFLPSHSVPLI